MSNAMTGQQADRGAADAAGGQWFRANGVATPAGQVGGRGSEAGSGPAGGQAARPVGSAVAAW